MNVTKAMRKASFSPARKRMSLAFLILDLLYIVLGFSCFYYRRLPVVFKNLLPHMWLVLMALALIVACIAIFAVSEYDVMRGCLGESVILAVEGVWFGAAATGSTMLTRSPNTVVQLFFMIGFGCFLILNLAFHIDLIWYRPIMQFLTGGRSKTAETAATPKTAAPSPRVYPPSDIKHRRAARKAYYAQNRTGQQPPTPVAPKAESARPQPEIQVVRQPTEAADATRVLPNLSANPTARKTAASKSSRPMAPPRRARSSKVRPHTSTKPAKATRTFSKKPAAGKRSAANSSEIADNAGLFIRSKERVYRHVDREK
ncbi:hypothetical protein [Pseudoramibacter faecis]|uniref:hypothetical protein n=1 Tax=Pseudoramibacter faecis TaxID=3108534 RepID=UPI002E7A8E05|nr:hypothetical protein [Pseudoramibacter sp. HA2172]